MLKHLLARLVAPLASHWAAQLAHPRGWIGRVLVTRALNRRNRELIETALDQLELSPRTRLLDVGFGGGLSLELGARRGVRQLAGVDPSEAAVRQLLSRSARWRGSSELRVLCGSVEALPFGNAEFDAILSTNTVYFWKDLGPAFGELRRVLAPGGRLALGFATPAELKAMDAVTQHGFLLRDSGVLMAEAERAGFVNLRLVELEGRDTQGDQLLLASA
jgi:SAM-dependent methyltransferase